MERERLPHACLAVAILIFLAAALRDVAGPWPGGFRGVNGACYSATFVRNHLRLGLAETRGVPVLTVLPGTPPVAAYDWHHPPLHPLILTAAAAVFGEGEAVLRLAHLALAAPLLPALFLLSRRLAGSRVAGFTTLMTAAMPLAAYWAPMVLQDGPVLAWGLVALLAFHRYSEAPSRRRYLAAAAAYFIACQLDFHGHLFGLSMALLGLVSRHPGSGLLRALALLPVSLGAFGLNALHYGTVLGGPVVFLKEVARIGGGLAREGSGLETRAVIQAIAVFFEDSVTLPVAVLVLAGLVIAVGHLARGRPRPLFLAAILLLPGVVHCGIFFGHAIVHPYWPLPGAPGIGCLAGLLIAAATGPRVGGPIGRGRVRTVARYVTIVAVLAGAGGAVARTHRLIAMEDREGPVAQAELIREVAGPADIVLSSEIVGAERYYADRFMIGEIRSLERFEALLAIARKERLRHRVVVMLGGGAGSPELRARVASLAAAPEPRGRFLVFVLESR